MRYLAGLGILLLSCTPVTSAYLSLPIEATVPGGVDLAVIRLPLGKLRQHLEAPDAAQFAVYTESPDPIPHQLIDRDGDGVADELMVKLAVPAGGLTLAIVSPGPTTDAAVPEGGKEFAVTVHFDRSRR